MPLSAADRSVLDQVTAAADALVTRAVDWAGINSGSGNADGLTRMLAELEAAAATLPCETTQVATAPSVVVGEDGEATRRTHAQ